MMRDDYFYEHEADSYSFIRVPCALLHDARYRRIDPAAKLLSRVICMVTAPKNSWIDKERRVFIFYTVRRSATPFAANGTRP